MQDLIAIDDPRDCEYVREQFVLLDDICAERGEDAGAVAQRMDAALLPAAAYVLGDGTRFVPRDYFDCVIARDAFVNRFTSEAGRLGLAPSAETADEEWAAFLSGVYFVCLHDATPENIARKGALLLRIETLTASPQPENAAWVEELRQCVDALDALERPFSPVYDRTRFGRPPTRDTHIRDVRMRFKI